MSAARSLRTAGISGWEFGDRIGIVGDEPDALALEISGIEIAHALAMFVLGFALHAKDDAAVGEGIR